MRNVLCSRRGSVAFATVVALVPLVGALALGAEAGSWYVTKQQAQTAADAAAYSGALTLACTLGPSCTDTSVINRGKEFAARNAFCNSGESFTGCATLASGTSQSVVIAQSGNRVDATVSQTQPTNLALLLGLTTVTIGATAAAQVEIVANPCALSLTDPLALQGSANVNTSGCGLASNSKASNSIDLTGNGIDVSNLGAVSGQGGCAETGGSRCNQTMTYAPAAPNPLSGLDAPMAILTASNATFTGTANGKCSGSAPVAYTAATKCYNDRLTINSNTTLNGVYFFGGMTKISGSPTITGTATLIMLPGATLQITGNPVFNLTAPTTITAAQVPTALQGSTTLALMSKLLLYISESTSGNQSVNVQGNTGSSFNGIVYAPNADVTYTGSAVSGGCNMVIAKGVTLSGNSTFDNSGCPAGSKSEILVVKMVQ
jgi:hypothetical protein